MIKPNIPLNLHGKHIHAIIKFILFYLFIPINVAANKYSLTDNDSLSVYKSLADSGHWIEALYKVNRFIDINEDCDATHNPYMSEAHRIAGRIYSGFGDYTNAARHYKACHNIAMNTGNYDLAMRAAANSVVMTSILGEEQEARKYYAVLDSLCRKRKDPDAQFILTIADASMERYFGQRDMAIRILKDALRMIEEGNVNQSKRIIPLSELTELYEEKGETDSVWHYLRIYSDEAMKSRQSHIIVHCMRLYTKYYAMRGDADSVLVYQDKYFSLRDSLLNVRSFLNVTGNANMIREEKHLNVINSLNQVVGRQWAGIAFLIFFAIMLAVFGVVVYSQKRRLNKAYHSLWEQSRELAYPCNKIMPCTALVTQKQVSPEQENKADTKDYTQLLEKIRKVMEESQEWLTQDFSLQKMAELTGSNTKYVSSVINETSGKNFRSFINEYRIREAQRRIADREKYGKFSIQGIGESVGFRSQTNFIDAFKRYTGLTPSMYLNITLREGSKN